MFSYYHRFENHNGRDSKFCNLQLFAIIFKQTLFCAKKNPATPLYEFKEPFKKLFSSQNAFLIISSEGKKKKNSLSSRKNINFQFYYTLFFLILYCSVLVSRFSQHKIFRFMKHFLVTERSESHKL